MKILLLVTAFFSLQSYAAEDEVDISLVLTTIVHVSIGTESVPSGRTSMDRPVFIVNVRGIIALPNEPIRPDLPIKDVTLRGFLDEGNPSITSNCIDSLRSALLGTKPLYPGIILGDSSKILFVITGRGKLERSGNSYQIYRGLTFRGCNIRYSGY